MESVTVDPAARTVSGTHVYADNGRYHVSLTVTDEHGAAHSDGFTVTVNNAPPTLSAGADQNVAENDTVRLAATFSDAGSGDTHALVINWGDGTGAMAASVDEANGQIVSTHVYSDAGVYTVDLTLSDDDGATVTDTLGGDGDRQHAGGGGGR